MESIYCGVPMIFYPHQDEQRMSAQCTVERGRGVLLEKDITAISLREAVDRVAQDALYCQRVQPLR